MKRKIMFFILLSVTFLFSMIWILAGYVYMNSLINRHNSAIVKIKKEMVEATERVRAIPAMTRKLKEMELSVEKQKGQMVPIDSISTSIDRLSKMANQFQLSIKTINFSLDSIVNSKPVKTGSFSQGLPVNMKIEGGFLDLGMLLESLNRLPFYINISDIRIQATANKRKLIIETRAWLRIKKT